MTMTKSAFAAVELAPKDPILGVTEAFRADKRAGKTNLGVGVYTDEQGRIPLLASVQQAEELIVAKHMPRGYLPIEGLNGYIAEVQQLLFGTGATALEQGRVATFETLGGTGALKVAADFLRRLNPAAKAWISSPSWENHRALLEYAGFTVDEYPYYDAVSHGLDFDAMLSVLRGASKGDVIVLHACCHNPTGVDLSPTQWRDVIALCSERELMPLLDMAYQGFAEGSEADATALRMFVDAGLNLLVANSFSKSFSLYGERVGALSIVTSDRDESARVTSQVKRVIRTNYSNPPTHGGSIVATVLASPALRATWDDELTHMRERIRKMREGLVSRLDSQMRERGVNRSFAFIARQRGMFSYSGLSAAQVETIKSKHGIYAISSGRICLAALNDGNIDLVANAIAEAVTTG